MTAVLLFALAAAPTVELSLRKSVISALEKSPSVGAARAGEEAAGGQYLEARGFALPQFSAEVSATALSGAGGFYQGLEDMPGELPEGAFPDKEIYAGYLNLTQVVYEGGLVRAGISAARLNQRMAGETVAAEQKNVIYRVKLAYYDVLFAEALLGVADEAVELARSHRKDVELKLRQGAASEFEFLRAKVEVQNLLSSRLRAEKGLELARERLLSELDLPRGTRPVLTDPLPGDVEAGDFEAELERAIVHRSELMLVDLEVQLYRLNIRRARAGYKPRVDFIFRWGDDMYKGPVYEEWDPTWSATLALRAPIFDGLQAHGRVIQAKAAVRALEEKRKGLRRMVELELRAALSSVAMARQFLAAQSKNVELAAEALRLAQERFREGMSTQLEVQDSRLGLSQAETNLAQAQYELARAGLELEKATGKLELPEGVR